MKQHPPPLSHAFDVRLSDERVERAWQRIERATPRRRAAGARRPRWPVVLAAALAVALLAVAGVRDRSADTFDGAVIETGPGERQSLQLFDGSRLLLSASTRLRLVCLGRRHVRLELQRGAVSAQVTHVPGRDFVVAAGDVEVQVVGTRFDVKLGAAGDDVRVSVAEGRVRLSSTSGRWPESYVAAGQTWSSPLATPAEAPPTGDLDASLADEPAPPPPRRAAPARRSTLSGTFGNLYRQGRYAEAYDTLGPDGFAAAAQQATPDELMMLAETARLSRHTTDAALAFDTLRSHYPQDSRAALAAMELGRLRLNELDDPEGAKDAFEDAVQLDPDGPLREDAEARRVEAIERTGDLDACRAARDEYLRDYPQGVHTASVARMCR